MAGSFARTTRALDADRGAGAALLLWGALALLAAWGAWFAFARVAVYEVSRSARIEVAGASRTVSSEQGGRLVGSGLFIGRQVAAGDVLAELDSSAQRLRLAEAEARLAGFPARLAALREQLSASLGSSTGAARAAAATIAAARAHSREADAAARFQDDLARRQQADSAAGAIAPIDAARADSEARRAAALRDASTEERRRAEGDAATARASRRVDSADIAARLAEAESEAAAAAALADQLRREADLQKIRAPISGVIGEVSPVRAGDVLAPGARLATIVPAGSLRLVATFPAATALGRIAQGQSARLRLDGFSWAEYGTFPARVERVAADGSDGALRVELAMANPQGSALILRHGMTGEVDVVIEQVSPLMLLLRTLGQFLA
ncbi:HlyD family efflux transporter periplasmic adaptor subunit [Novosphingobium sp. PASSN1]|uniref:HlyD family secretion protein n=1 Tax=Novosphingobium sp. PASSN1 TaxID=2015561 RepID=UPI000BD31009|nr:HlyD family efflux transporter periplasmic adaptor subunit [Novosphingobium sp. PASSN1]OYU37053.1 MAG: hypothetical protein CFE35_01335 [Novosphingobium sp. PASSN1]